MAIRDLGSFVSRLREQGDLLEIAVPVDPHLEIAEIHRRVIAAGGPALLFSNVQGTHSRGRVVTNLFGSERRIDCAFGQQPERIVRNFARLPHEIMPFSGRTVRLLGECARPFLNLGTRTVTKAPVLEEVRLNPKLTELPFLTTRPEDGGPFITLPLVDTAHSELGVRNLGMYRIQIYNDSTTGLHTQIGKGGGSHLHHAGTVGRMLPVNIYVGGPPALILAAIAPLPENVPEILLASLVAGERIRFARNPYNAIPVLADAEVCLTGFSNPHERRPEGPFGDHYGYYSLTHDYPVFHCTAQYSRRSPLIPATVVGKPRQEDFYLGDYLQKLLSPLFPIAMPTVRDLWSYGETGYHSLTAAVVQERYKREALVSAFRILGEGQLSLTKFLLVLDTPMDLRDFPRVLTHILERVDFRTDLYLFSNLSMNSLDYTGPRINEGSKGVLLGVGAPIRTLPRSFEGNPPRPVTAVSVFSPGCLVISIEGPPGDAAGIEALRGSDAFSSWPLVVIVDDVRAATRSTINFLWTTFTRFEPGRDISGRAISIAGTHLSFTPPIFIDARMKPPYPKELFCDDATREKVTRRWNEYFPNGLEMGDSDKGHLD